MYPFTGTYIVFRILCHLSVTPYLTAAYTLHSPFAFWIQHRITPSFWLDNIEAQGEDIPFDKHVLNMASNTLFQRPLTPTSSASSTEMSDIGTPLEEPNNTCALSTALHVIRTERDALTALEDLYETDSVAQEGLNSAVNVISKSVSCGGKIVVSGVGKSGKIGKKVVATMNSFGIRSVFLHPTEALHGDLGIIGEVSAAWHSIVMMPDTLDRTTRCSSSLSLERLLRSLQCYRIYPPDYRL